MGILGKSAENVRTGIEAEIITDMRWYRLLIDRKVENIMNKTLEFTQEELQLLYAACMSYGDKLAEIKKSIPDEGKDILDNLADRAKGSWNLARKITEYMEDKDNV